jgi:hypothetical protein
MIECPLLRIAAAPSFFGIFCHLAFFIRGEWDRHTSKLMLLSLTILPTLQYCLPYGSLITRNEALIQLGGTVVPPFSDTTLGSVRSAGEVDERDLHAGIARVCGEAQVAEVKAGNEEYPSGVRLTGSTTWKLTHVSGQHSFIILILVLSQES